MKKASEPDELAVDVWLDFLRRRPEFAEDDFERLCAEHAAIAGELRRVRGTSSRPEARAAAAADADVSIDERLRRLSEPVARGARYVDEGTLARGGMGEVHLVRDVELGRRLALKKMSTKPSTSGSLGAARFLEEAQVTAQLDHPGIVPVHEVGVDHEGRLFYAMKLVRGRDLRMILGLYARGEEGWNMPRILTVLLRVCEAMAFAHAKGVVHRDLKPSNVMVGHFGEVYVMDWGLARTLGRPDLHDLRIQKGAFASSIHTVRRQERESRESDDSSPLLTMDGVVVGTPAYMSPEQARGETDQFSARSDVYSIGAILYHVLTGQAPFVPSGAKIPAQSILWRVIEGPPTRVPRLRAGVPPELVAIQEKAMAHDPARRYRDTHELGADLRAYLEQRVVHAYQSGPIADLAKWVVRNRFLAGAIGTAFVLLVAGLTTSVVFKADADHNAALARENARVAELNERRADAEAAAAREKSDEVLRLSALQRLEDLVAEADRLWPAEPGLVPRYEDWLRRAHALVAELPHHEQSLAERRAKALPETEQDRRARRAAHPKYAELEQARHRVEFLRRFRAAMEASEPAREPVPAEVGLVLDDLRATPGEASLMAWNLVDPRRDAWGREKEGLVLARHALARAAALPAPERARIRDTLAWALFANGRLDEAIAEAERAVEECGDVGRAKLEQSRARLHARIEEAIDPEREEGRAAELAELEARIASLEAEVEQRREWRFADDEDRWWHNQLEKLMAEIEAFSDLETGLLRGNSHAHGWGVEKRLDFARTVARRSVTGPEASRRWAEAIASIATVSECPVYRGLVIAPQLGLLPIGRDPDSGLWEFAHLQTGTVPARDSRGKLLRNDWTGLVFVLLPGGIFKMGAQSTDPGGDNYDPDADANESPVHEVMLSPFFLSKYEMTQGQWQQFVDHNPSQHRPDTYLARWNRAGRPGSYLHPVERVSWTDCSTVVTRMGLELPSEAQWEYGARAGTTSMWWTGNVKQDLFDAGNVADAYAWAHGARQWENHELEVDDGSTVHVPSGNYRANAFGLHETIGNVLEWCRDGYHVDSYSRGSTRDPVRPTEGTPTRVDRGGSYDDRASFARSADRQNELPESATDTIGVRPARTLIAR